MRFASTVLVLVNLVVPCGRRDHMSCLEAGGMHSGCCLQGNPDLALLLVALL